MPNFTPSQATKDEIVADLERMLEDARQGVFAAYVFVAVTADSNMAKGMVIPGGIANGLLYMALDGAKNDILALGVQDAFQGGDVEYVDFHEQHQLSEMAAAEAGVEMEDPVMVASAEEIELERLTQEALARSVETGIGGVPVQEVLASDPEGGDVPDMAGDLEALNPAPPVRQRQRRVRKG